jgi:hypothetical protein
MLSLVVAKAMIKANGNRKISIAFVWEEIYEK